MNIRNPLHLLAGKLGRKGVNIKTMGRGSGPEGRVEQASLGEGKKVPGHNRLRPGSKQV